MAKKIPDYYGQGGRLKKDAHPLLVDSAYKHDSSQADILLEGMHYADLAHAIILTEGGIIPKPQAKKLMKALLRAQKIAWQDFPIRPELGDVYNSKDAYLKAEIGDVAGWIHAGRPRREAVNISYLYAVRDRLLELMSAHEELIAALLSQARKNVDTIMPDYTYLQHAHPTTLGHYLLTSAYPMMRDLDRLKENYIRVDNSPAGSGSVNGTRLPVDRRRLQELLGFTGLSTHTRDAMWQADIPIETMADISILMLNVNRLAEELIIFSTSEFNIIDLPDSICRASVIMPQKKNPYALTYIRGLAGDFLGKTASLGATVKTYSGNPDSRIFIYDEVPRALQKATEAVRLMAEVVKGIKPNKALMLQRATEGFCQVTDIADVIMQEAGLDYRTTHQIMGAVVARLTTRGQSANAITAQLINEVAKEVTGKNISLDEALVAKVKRPKDIIEHRRGVGGASGARVKAMVQTLKTGLSKYSLWRKRMVQNNARAKNRLVAAAGRLVE